jgi:hypothetical protein
MVQALPEPTVLRCYFDEAFEPHLPAMCLRWAPEDSSQEQLWKLPEGICIRSHAPRRFGVSIQRQAEDAYSVRLLWDHTSLQWLSLSRDQLLTSSLAPMLQALGTDLWYLLDQPLGAPDPSDRAA